jgi:3D (Asp-Asp-Asp) domain-containing protein
LVALLGFAWRVAWGTNQPHHPAGGGGQQTVIATAYCSAGLTAAGTWTGWGTAASDLPLGTELYVPGYGKATVLDRGGGIGPGRLDLYMPNCTEAEQWGRRSIKVSILGVEQFRQTNARFRAVR